MSVNWLISGSVALRHWFPEFSGSVSNDIDLLTPLTITSSKPSELLVDCDWHDAASYMLAINEDRTFLDADSLFTLKVSHANWNIKWEKTMGHIHFMQMMGCKLNLELYDKLIPVWNQVHGKKQVNLNQPLDQFFDDYVDRKFNHEELHRKVMFNDRPMHEMIRKDLSNAFVSRDMFYELSREQQLETMMEEMLVIAIERFNLLDAKKKSEKYISASKALKQLITSMTTGWFSRELILSHFEILDIRREKWMTKL